MYSRIQSTASTLSPSSEQDPIPISVLLVDDDSFFRSSLESLLELCGSSNACKFVVVGQAASVEQALCLVEEQSPMLVLLNLDLNQQDGVEFLRQQSGGSKCMTLAISNLQDDAKIFQVMQAGARGCLCKSQIPMDLLEAISVVRRGEIYLSPKAATCFFRGFHFYSGRSLQSKPSIHLTTREREVLHWVVQGASNVRIAQELSITVGTVKAYLTAIFEKLEVKSRTQAALKALRLGLVYPASI